MDNSFYSHLFIFLAYARPQASLFNETKAIKDYCTLKRINVDYLRIKLKAIHLNFCELDAEMEYTLVIQQYHL